MSEKKSLRPKELLRIRGYNAVHKMQYNPDGLTATEKSIDRLTDLIDGLVSRINPENLQCETLADLYKLTISVSALAKARVEQEKLKLEAAGMMSAASEQLKTEIRQLLSKDQDLAERMRNVILQAQENIDLGK